MIRLELTDAEAAILRETLEQVLQELSHEIADTDSKDFRDGLKDKRTVLVKIAKGLIAS